MNIDRITRARKYNSNYKSIRLNVILEHKNCKAERFDKFGHKLQCGLIAVEKKVILESFKSENKIDTNSKNNNIHRNNFHYNCKEIFLDQFMSIICINNMKQYDQHDRFCQQPTIKRKNKKDGNVVVLKYKAKDVMYTENRRHFFVGG